MASGYNNIPNPLAVENKTLKAKLKQEKNKVVCAYCNGAGYIRTNGPSHYSESSCSKCNGEGRY